MKASIQPVGRPAGLLSLSLTREPSAFCVANVPLGRLQAQRLVEAGFQLEPSPEPGDPYLVQRSDAWLSLGTLGRLRAATSPVRSMDASGTPLAWVVFPGSAGDPFDLETEGEDLLIRYPWDLLKLNEILVGRMENGEIRGEISPAAHLEGRVRLGSGSRILPGVYVEGNVVIGEHCKIGPNSYLRGSTAIGDHCHIGQAVEVKNSIIGNRCAIGHLSYCGDSVLGDGVNLGAGTITSNFRHDGANHLSLVDGVLVDTGRRKFGAVVGDGVHTGIHTSIYPGRKLWPGTSTRPGEVVQRDRTPD